MPNTKRDQILRLLKKTRVLRPQDVEAVGISRTYLNKLHSEGVLDRPSRGLYILQDDEPSEQRSLVEACRRVLRGVVCLLSALQFHGLTTQAPFEVWMAIDESARLPLQIDIGFGDAITPGPQAVTYPTLLDFPAPQMNAYPRETVVAEKFQAMVQLCIANSRMKDFYDVWALARQFEFDGTALCAAIQATFQRRQTPLPATAPLALTPEFSTDRQKATDR